MRILTFLLIWGAGMARAADSSAYMERAADGLRRGLAAVGTWEEMRSADQIVMQCRDCQGPVTVVVRIMEDYAEGSGFAHPMALYDAGRVQMCSELVAERRGRCLDDHRSVEDGRLVHEVVQAEGPHLHAGYVSSDEGAREVDVIVPVLRDAVRRLSPLW